MKILLNTEKVNQGLMSIIIVILLKSKMLPLNLQINQIDRNLLFFFIIIFFSLFTESQRLSLAPTTFCLWFCRYLDFHFSFRVFAHWLHQPLVSLLLCAGLLVLPVSIYCAHPPWDYHEPYINFNSSNKAVTDVQIWLENIYDKKRRHSQHNIFLH